MTRIIALLLMTTAAQAQQAPCAAHDDLLKVLQNTFGETVQASGPTQGGKFMELLSNSKTGTWTFVLTSPAGLACMMTAGGKLVVVPPGDPA